MADIALAVPALFNIVVEDIRWIQEACHFETSFQTAVIRISSADMRLTRWGQAMGIQEGQPLDVDRFGKRNVKEAESMLEQVRKLLRKAKEKKQFYHREESLSIAPDEQEDNDDKGLPLHTRLRRLSIRRKSTEFFGPVKWALFDKNLLEELVNSLTTLVKDLEELFPAAQQTLNRLAKNDLEVLGKDVVEEVVAKLKEVGSSPDTVLERALKAASSMDQ